MPQPDLTPFRPRLPFLLQGKSLDQRLNMKNSTVKVPFSVDKRKFNVK